MRCFPNLGKRQPQNQTSNYIYLIPEPWVTHSSGKMVFIYRLTTFICKALVNTVSVESIAQDLAHGRSSK